VIFARVVTMKSERSHIVNRLPVKPTDIFVSAGQGGSLAQPVALQKVKRCIIRLVQTRSNGS
jgi:hypothetical protein